MYQVEFLIISHHVTPNVTCHVSSRARSPQLVRRQRLPLHTTGCVHASLSLSLSIPTTATAGPNTPPPLSCFWVWVRGYCPFLSFGAHRTPLHPHFLILGRGHYNLFSTCKYVLSLSLYFKPNDAILKHHIFLFKPQLRHLVLGPQGVGAWRFQNVKALGVPGGFPSWQHTEEYVESPKRAKLDAILKRQLFKTLQRHLVFWSPVTLHAYSHLHNSCPSHSG